jgi:uncharacterized protein YfaS (alpha-2-macroglobulin family)
MRYFIAILILFGSFLSAADKKVTLATSLESKSTEDTISLCVEIDDSFGYPSSDEIKPYVKVTPSGNYKIRGNYSSICVDGVKPDTNYTVTINKDIPLNAYSLNKSYTFTKKSTNYKPSIKFKESGYILPAKGDITIPIESRNVDKLEISLYRINRNNLINTLHSTNLKDEQSNWRLNKIENRSGYLLWEKKLAINKELNKKVVTAIPVGSVLKSFKPGVYLLAAYILDKDGVADYYSVKTQWFMVSDVGVYTLWGVKGLHVYTKHLSNALAYSDVKVEVIANNNEVLAKGVTKDGYAFFENKFLAGKKGMKPKAIYAYGKDGDFSLLNLTAPKVDLTDRGDGGIEARKGYSAYIFTNRGIFKPKSVVDFYALVKDVNKKSANNLSLSAKLYRAEYVEIATKLLNTNELGFLSGKFKLPNETGRYTIKIYAGDSEPIGEYSFGVEDFIPPKIEVKVLSKPDIIEPNTEANLKMQVNFLTGEGLSNADIDYSVKLLSPKVPFKEYKDYYFGRIDESTYSNYFNTRSAVTDANATADIVIEPIQRVGSVTKPLQAKIISYIKDPGGRAIVKVVKALFNNRDGYIGIKPKFEYDAIELNQRAMFDLIYLKKGKPHKQKLNYKLIEEEAIWNWRSSEESDWEYYREYSDIKVLKTGSIDVANSPTTLALDKLEWGYYRLEVEDINGSVSSYRFSSGYDESASKVSPDKLPLLLDKKSYKDGDTIKVQVTPKFSGSLIVNIASSDILKSKELKVKANKPTEVSFKVKKEWGSGVYVLATAFRAQSKKLGANRAIGLAYAKVEDISNSIKLDLKLPKKVKANSKLSVDINAKSSDKEVNVALFAVDKGVLNLTNFKTPNPYSYFFGKHKLGVTIRDIYSELIKAQGQHAAFDTGAGDGESDLINEPTANKRLVVALSKVVKLNNGKATVEFDIPDYQGALRVMGVAWSKSGIGVNEDEVVVKDPVSAQMYMPKFLSVGDFAKSLVTVNFDTTTPKGEYRLKFSSNSVLDIEPREFVFNTNSVPKFKKYVNFSALKEGEATIKLDVYKDKKVVASREFKIASRASQINSFTKRLGILDANATLDSKSVIDSKKFSSIKGISLKIQASPMLDIGAIKKELKAYCCRCGEQTSSRGFGFLSDKDNKDIVNNSIARLYELQKYDGGFGLWSESKASLWVSSYALDFLTEAKKAGFSVKQDRINSGLKFLEKSLNRWSKESKVAEANAYALYVLAKNSKPLISEVMYHINNKEVVLKSASGWAHLAAVLSMVGEKDKAKSVFNLAKSHLGESYYGNFGGSLRDKALLVKLLCESGLKALAQPIFVDLSLDAKDKKYLSTQEMSTLIRASEAIDIPTSKLNIEVDSAAFSGNSYSAKFKDISSLPTIKNLAQNGIWYSISFVAMPNSKNINELDNKGFSIQKEYYNSKGEIVDLNNIKAGDEVIVFITGKIEDSSIEHPIVIDLLPAGLEIENPNITGYSRVAHLGWGVKLTDTEHEEYRDDRYIAALEPYSNGDFAVAYSTRAVTKGKFNLPLAFINDMYKPKFRAFNKLADTIEIKDAKDIVKKAKKSNTSKEHNATLDANAIKLLYNGLDSNKTQELLEDDYIKASKVLVGSLKKYTTKQLNYLRNGIFAQVGLDFNSSNKKLDAIFSKFKWYKPTITSGAIAFAKLNKIQKSNVIELLKEEKARLGGLSISDYDKVHTQEVDSIYLSRYNKKQLRLLRNSLIARYGYEFKDKELFKIFSNLSWYKSNKSVTTSKVIDELMSVLDRKNLDTILKVEKEAK